MADLETQVGQIFISNRKLSRSFVSLFSEKIPETGAEIYVLAEAAVLNPASWDLLDRISKMFASDLRRNFRRENPNAFENSIAQINDDLSRLAEQKQTSWVGKLNACLAVRSGEELYIATTGKIHAYLFRSRQFSDLADSPKNPSPLKTFENFALGKVGKKDTLIFTTTQLFNYLSVQRLEQILSELPLAQACQQVSEIIKDSADQTVAFGTLVLELGAVKSEPPSALPVFTGEKLESSSEIEQRQPFSFKSLFAPFTALLSYSRDFVKHMLLVGKKTSAPTLQVPEMHMPKLNWHKLDPRNLKNIDAGAIKEKAKSYADIQKFRELPRAKKFFLASAAILLIALVADIAVTSIVSHSKKAMQAYNSKLADIENKINDANIALIYNDPSTNAPALVKQAKDELSSLPDDSRINDQKKKLADEIAALQNSINNVKVVSATKLLTYASASADRLIALAGRLYVINTGGDLFSAYALNGSKIGNDFTVSLPQISDITSSGSSFVFSDAQGNLYQVSSDGSVSKKIEGASLPASAFGLITVSGKFFAIDKNGNKIVATGTSGQTSYLKQPMDLSNALDLGSDGSAIYVLTKNALSKFMAGQPRAMQDSGQTFGEGARLFIGNNIYILDPASSHLIVVSRSGKLIAQYSSGEFGQLKDFAVDEAHKTVYILSGSDVLVIHL